jgi:hypothetical protein
MLTNEIAFTDIYHNVCSQTVAAWDKKFFLLTFVPKIPGEYFFVRSYSDHFRRASVGKYEKEIFVTKR